MDGKAILLKTIMDAAGVKINPAEIEQAVNEAKVLLPRIAQQFNSLSLRLDSMANDIATLKTLANAGAKHDAMVPEVTHG